MRCKRTAHKNQMYSTLVKKLIAKEKKAFYQENVKVEANNYKKNVSKRTQIYDVPIKKLMTKSKMSI